MPAKHNLIIEPPLMNAAGSLGFAPDSHGSFKLAQLGAFITNPISSAPRAPASGIRCLPASGSFLLHTGHPNPGLHAILKRSGRAWFRAPLPVLVHLLGDDPNEIHAMTLRLERVEGVTGLEVGIPPHSDGETVIRIAQAAVGELPVIIRLPLDRALELSRILAEKGGLGVTAVSLGPPRGALPNSTGQVVSGRLYGPAVFPLALEAVRSLSGIGLAVIGAGGVYSQSQADAMLAAGALAVQLDSVLWRGGW